MYEKNLQRTASTTTVISKESTRKSRIITVKLEIWVCFLKLQIQRDGVIVVLWLMRADCMQSPRQVWTNPASEMQRVCLLTRFSGTLSVPGSSDFRPNKRSHPCLGKTKNNKYTNKSIVNSIRCRGKMAFKNSMDYIINCIVIRDVWN